MKKIIYTFILFLFLSKSFAQFTVCKGTTREFNVAYNTGNTYSWKITPSTGTSITTSYTATTASALVNFGTAAVGTYTVEVTETNASLCSGSSVSQTVYVVGNPTISYSNLSICSGSTATFATPTITAGLTGSAPAATGTASYTWTAPSGYTGATNTQVITTGIGGTYSVVYKDTYGCVAPTVSPTVTVNPLPPSSFTANGPTEFCYNSSVTLTGPTGTYTYKWLADGVVIPSQTSQTLTAGGTSNAYKQTLYQLKVTDTNNCTTTTSPGTTVTVNPIPTVTISGSRNDFNFCSNESLVLTADATNGTGSLATSFAYNWTKNPSATSIGTNNTYTVSGASAGSYGYNVKVTDNKSCSATVSETVYSRPVPNPVLSVHNPFDICAGGTVTITDIETVPAGSNFDYSWADGSTVVDNDYEYVFPTSPADASSSKTYSLVVTDSAYSTNCFNGTSITVNVNAIPPTTPININ